MNTHRQRGIALVMVLWITILVTITTGAYALMARVDQLEANALLSGTQARMIAEAGIHLTAVLLRNQDEMTRLIADGRSYEQEIDGVLLEIRVTDERGKLDINSAEELTLLTLFTNNGVELEQAELLAAAVLDWRDIDELERVNGAEFEAYAAAGLPVGPGNRPFMMNAELLQVIGMSFDLYRRIEPGITVFSKSAMPNIAFAPVEALLAIPDINLDDAVSFVQERQLMEPGETQSVVLADGQVVMAQGRGLTYSIQSKATMPNGVWEQLDTTIRLGGSRDGMPFRIMRWREGFYH
ncbi:MAG: general secretion pathway protein K [Lysobacterales bacterium]|jgi:general secretion pathway protein K